MALLPHTGRATSPPPATPATYTAGSVTLRKADESGVTFELVPPSLERRPVLLEAGRFEQLHMAGYGQMEQAGAPNVPQTSFLIALPPGAEPRLAALDSSSEMLSGIRVAPGATRQLANSVPAELAPASLAAYTPEFATTYNPDPAHYAASAAFPAQVVALGDIFWLRDQRVVQVWVRPVQVQPAQESIRLYNRLNVTLAFDYPAGPREPQRTRPESAAYEAILRDNVLNYESGRAWREAQPIAAAPGLSPCLGKNAFRLTLQEAGMYKLTYGELVTAGLAGTPAAATLRMCQQDQEISIRVVDGGDGVFNNGDYLIFYGEALRTQESHTNVYWLTYGGDNGLRMAAAMPSGNINTTSYSLTVHLEDETFYKSDTPMSDANDHWYWHTATFVPGGSGSPFETSFILSDIATTVHEATLQIELYGQKRVDGANTTYQYAVELNGHSLGIEQFTGDHNTRHVFTAAFDSSLLQNGANTLSLTPLNVNEQPYAMQLNWVKLSFRRHFVAEDERLLFTQDMAGEWQYAVSGFNGSAEVYNLADAQHPEYISNVGGSGTIHFAEAVVAPTTYALHGPAGYLNVLSITKDTPSNWRTAHTADLIIITDPLFNEALDPLRERRQSQGLVVKTVYVQDIFDEFSYGIYSPQAIGDFLAYAYANWDGSGTTAPPTYTLLVGEGSYDHHNHNGQNGPHDNLVPVYLLSGADSFLGETTADNRYVAWNDNPLAQMQLGRLPVAESEELTIVIDKILSYEDEPFDLLRHTSHFFMADNAHDGPRIGNPAYCHLDPAGNFFGTLDRFISGYVNPAGQTASRIYYAPLTCYPNPDAGPLYDVYHEHFAGGTVDVQARILSSLNAGPHFVVYNGHSGILQWGRASESFMSAATITVLDNAERLSILLPLTCLEGIYHFPEDEYAGISERLLRAANGGAVASFAPTGLQVQTAHDLLIEGFYNALFVTGYDKLGSAVIQAKSNLQANGSPIFQDLQDTFMLLGDPAMPVKHWQGTEKVWLPFSMKP